MKKAVVILSEKFSAKHKRAGEPTKFFQKIDSGEKIHTIRENLSWWASRVQQIKAGKMYLSIRKWSGKPYHSAQIEHAKRFSAGVQQITMSYGVDDTYQAFVDGKKVSIQDVAKNDGLSIDDFIDWFFGNSKSNVFTGVVLHFTDFRY